MGFGFSFASHELFALPTGPALLVFRVWSTPRAQDKGWTGAGCVLCAVCVCAVCMCLCVCMSVYIWPGARGAVVLLAASPATGPGQLALAAVQSQD